MKTKCVGFRPGWLFACAWLIATSIWAQPVNDNFANAESLSGSYGSVSGSNAGATTVPGEPACFVGSSSVWYRWTAPASGSVVFDTLGSALDTTLAAYTGTSLSNLVSLACNDDYYGAFGSYSRNSRITFTAQAGVDYYIAVQGYYGSVDSFFLNWQQIPAIENQVQFASQVYSADGNVPGMAVITVTCPFGATNMFSVDYQAAGGTASDGVDFSSQGGSLTFGIGDTEKTFAIPILGHGNNNSWVALDLSNPSSLLK